jgi:hypothetical protein
MRYLLPLALAALATAVPAKVSADVNEVATPIISVPFTAKHAGTYVLKRDLNFKAATGAAITIAADGVIIDLGGRTLTNTLAPSVTAPKTAAGVSASSHGRVTVRNGHISGFSRGVDLQAGAIGGGLTLVENLLVDHCSMTGIYVASSDIVEVRGCRVIDTGDANAQGNVWGIVGEGNTVNITGNDVFRLVSGSTPARGIQCGVVAFGTVANNRVETPTITNGTSGIIVFNNNIATAPILITDNRVSGFTFGISYGTATGKYRDNLTFNCTTPYTGGTAVGTTNN